MKRLFLTITMALSILMSGTANIDYAKEDSFGDVTGAVLYYEDIERLNDMGVLSGYDDDNFYPENNITVAEGITLAERAFGGADTLPKQWEDWFADRCGWMDNIHIDRYLFRGDFSKNMSYETAAEIVIKLRKLQPIDAALWGMRSTSYNRYINTLYIRGYTGKSETVPYSMGTLTRAEFCHMLTFMLDYDGSYTIPQTNMSYITPTVYMPETLEDSNAYILTAQSIILNIPETIRKSFSDNDYEVIIIPNGEWNKVFDNANRKVGLYVHSDKRIYIRTGYLDSLLHEFGHYVHSTLEDNGYDISTDESFKRRLGLFKYSNYYMTNDAEFFAESFDLYYTMPEKLGSAAPEVYEYIDNAVRAFEALKK